MSAAEPRPKRGRGLRRWARRGAWALLGSALLGVLLVVVVLFTSVGTRLLLRAGLGWYSGAIAGQIGFRSTQGSLADGVVIEGLVVADRHGRALIRVDRLRLGVDPWAALTGHVVLHDWQIAGGQVLVPPDDGYADLAPATDEPPPEEPDDDRLGPDLPVALTASLRVEGLDVRAGPTLEDAEDLVRVETLTLRAEGEGTRAAAWSSFTGELGAPAVRVESLDLAVEWDEPTVTVSRWRLRAPPVEVEVAAARADLRARALELPMAAVRLDPRGLEAELGAPLSEPATLWLRGAGRPEDMRVQLVLRAGPLGSAELLLHGAVAPRPSVAGRLLVHAVPEHWLPGASPGPVTLGVEASLHGDPGGRLQAELEARCHGCDPIDRALVLGVRADADPSTGQGEVWADFRHGATHVEAHAARRDELEAQLSIRRAELAQLAQLARRFGVEVPVEGSVEGEVDCTASPELTPLRCDIATTVTRGQPVQDAAIEASVSSEQVDRWAVELSTLSVAARPLRTELVTDGARVELGPEALSVEGLELMVATAKGRGRVSLDGALGRQDERASLALAVHEFDLAALDALAPGLGARGRLWADATLSGSLRDPHAELSARVSGARVGGVELGRVTASAGYQERSLSSRVTVRSDALGRATLDADLPVALSSERQALLEGEPVRVDLRVEGVELASLDDVIAPSGPLAGRVDARLGLRGSLRRPVLSAEVDGHALAYAGHALGEVSARADYRRGRASAELSVDHPEIDELHARATIPLSLGLMAGRARWHPNGAHEAEARIRGLGLELVEAWTSIPLRGEVSLDAALAGSASQPDIDTTLRFDDVAYDGRSLASGAVQTSYRDDQVSVRAHASGPAFAGLGLEASVPLTLDPVRGAPRWHPTRPHELDLSLAEVQLARVASWGPPVPDMAGRVDARLRISGDAHDPRVSASVEGEALAYGGREVGEVSLRADYHQEQAEATAQWTRDERRFVRIHGRTPLRIDPRTGQPHWEASAEHRLTVEAPRIDPVLLEPFVELPESLDFAVSLHGIAEGSPSDHSVRVSSRGFGTFGSLPRQPIALNLEIDEQQQQLHARLGTEDAPLALDVATRASTLDLVQGRVEPTQLPISASLRARALSLALLEALAPEQLYDVQGIARIDAGMRGTLAAPELSGRIAIEDAAATLIELRQRIEQFDVALSFDGNTLRLPELSLQSGRGTLTARGQARIEPDGKLIASASIHGDRLPLRRPGLPYLEVTTELSTRVDVDSRSTALAVDLHDTRVDVISTNIAEAKPIPSHPDVRYVVDLDEETTTQPPASEPDATPRATTMRLRLVDPLRIRGPAVDMAWTGELVATSRGEGVDASGSMQLQEGFFELLNNRFEIDSGEVTIPPAQSLRLYTDIVARAPVDEVEVTATIRGPLPRPELLLSSVPPYSASQLFALLLTGTADFDAADPERVQAQAASLLTAFSSPALQRQINERLRVDRIGLGVGESTNQPILSVGKSLSRKVYAETQYHHNAPDRSNRAELRVRYRFAPRWSLETFVGDAAVAGLDIFWGRVFDSPSR